MVAKERRVRSGAAYSAATTATSFACKAPDNAHAQKRSRQQCRAGDRAAVGRRRTRGALLSGRLPPLTTLGTLRAALAAGNARSIGESAGSHKWYRTTRPNLTAQLETMTLIRPSIIKGPRSMQWMPQQTRGRRTLLV